VRAESAVILLSGSYTQWDSKKTGFGIGDEGKRNDKVKDEKTKPLDVARRASLSNPNRHNGTISITIRVKNNGKTLVSLLHIMVARTNSGGRELVGGSGTVENSGTSIPENDRNQFKFWQPAHELFYHRQ
jgi:hypothetical protein